MKHKNPLILICFFVVLWLVACQQNEPPVKERKFPDNNTLIKTNRIVTTSEDIIIEGYIKRYGWNMIRTGSGLRYLIYQKSDDDKPSEGEKVTLNYSVHLINGILCYSSASDGPRVFRIGKDKVERGLEEGVLLMKKHEKAKFILPSHLGYGLTGDLNKIPPRAVLVYDVELTEIIK